MRTSRKDFEERLRRTLHDKASGLERESLGAMQRSRSDISKDPPPSRSMHEIHLVDPDSAKTITRRDSASYVGRAVAVVLLVAAIGAGVWFQRGATPANGPLATDSSASPPSLPADPDAIRINWEALPAPPLDPASGWAALATGDLFIVHGGAPLLGTGNESPSAQDNPDGSSNREEPALSLGAYYTVDSGRWAPMSESPIGLRNHILTALGSEVVSYSGNTLATGVDLFEGSLRWNRKDNTWAQEADQGHSTGGANLDANRVVTLYGDHATLREESGIYQIEGAVDQVASSNGLAIGWSERATVRRLDVSNLKWVDLPQVSAVLADLSEMTIGVGGGVVYYAGRTQAGDLVVGVLDPVTDEIRMQSPTGRSGFGPIQIASISNDVVFIVTGGVAAFAVEGTSLNELPIVIPRVPPGSVLVPSLSGDSVFILGWGPSANSNDVMFGRLTTAEE